MFSDTVSQVEIAPLELVPMVGPALGATPANTSGATQAVCAAMAAPDDKPAIYTCLGSILRVASALNVLAKLIRFL